MKKRFVFGLIVIIFFIFFIFSRGDRVEEENFIEKNTSFNVYKAVFKGDDMKDIYALLFAPLKKDFDVVIVLPGAAGTKESRRHYAEILLEMGHGAFIIDQRGIGETDGYFPSLNEDFEAFVNKKQVYQFLMASDVVRAVDFLNNLKDVRNIAVLGESMGGRNAIISAALDKRIKSAIIISSAGYSGRFRDEETNTFLDFIDPNSYIDHISPRRILMLHAVNDLVIPISDAKYTFSLANEPKRFVDFSEKECTHGYCKQMYNFIRDELALAFGRD